MYDGSNSPIDISIPLRFNGPQPNAFGVEPAAARSLGDTRLGSSVNFDQITLVPHCNGTHTECVGHITDERISVWDCLTDVLLQAVLVSVEPAGADGELLITREHLETVVMRDSGEKQATALIVRTLPNDDSKLSKTYDGDNIPPYFSSDAMEYVVGWGFKHILVDLPSIDRLFDEGRLINHRIFWAVELGSRKINASTRVNSTITELIYVPSEVADGQYLLNLQIAPFELDAAPSRPLLLSEPPAIAGG